MFYGTLSVSVMVNVFYFTIVSTFTFTIGDGSCFVFMVLSNFASSIKGVNFKKKW